MTKYIDAQGRSWPDAEAAQHEFLHDLPDLTKSQFTRFVENTSAFATAEENLNAMYEVVKNDPELSIIFGYYPVPFPDPLDPDRLIGKVITVQLSPSARASLLDRGFEDPGWKWNEKVPYIMNAVVPSWDVDNVPLFQEQRQAFNRRTRKFAQIIYAASDDTLNDFLEDL